MMIRLLSGFLVLTVISFSTQAQLSTAVTTVPGVQLQPLIVPNVESALQGLVPGLHVIQSNGTPGTETIMRLRGTSSIFAETKPLYVLDGIPIYTGPREVADQGLGGGWGAQFNPLSDLNTADIASIEVLKDAAATSIYGARGANGVILITTKRGQRNKTEIDFNYAQGLTSVTNRINSLDGPQYLQLLDEAWLNSGQTGQGPLPAIAGLTRELASGTNTDNLELILHNGSLRQMNLSMASGSDKTNFFLSGSYRDEEGVLRGNGLTRYTGRMNVSNQINKRLTLGVRLGINYTDQTVMPVGSSPGGGFNAAQANLPVIPLYNSDGTYFYPRDPVVFNIPGNNVASYQSRKEYYNEEHTRRFFIAANFSYKISESLSFVTDAALEQYYHTRANYLSKRLRNGSVGSGIGREGFPTAYAGYEKYSNNLTTGRSMLNYKKTSRNHRIAALAGVEYIYNENPEFFGEGEGYANDFTREPSAAAYKNQITGLALVANTHAFLGFFGNVNYAFKNRYLLGATLRTDGSSRFGANNKFVTFPAVSAGWILSEENFMKQQHIFSQLKLRASYGQSGNSGIGNYSSVERWSLNSNSRYLLQSGIQMQSLGSPDLKPEKQTQLDIGIDYGILKNRISGSIDFYDKHTRNLILSYDAPLSVGVAQQGLLLNAGALRNRGVELSISSKNINSRLFTWSSSFSFAHNANKVLDLGGISSEQLRYNKNIITSEGHPLGIFYLAEYAGVDAATGREMIYDLNGNRVAALSAAQIDAARKPQYDKAAAPKFFGGLGNTLTYKNFDLTALMTYSYGNYVLDEGERYLSYLSGTNNVREGALNRWTPQSPGTDFPQLVYNDPIAGSNTTRFLHDASYLRMKNITIGYSFKNYIRKIKFLRDARLYVSAQNLFTLTKFKGWDPEVSGNYSTSLDRNLNQGITYMDVPQVRTFAAGFNLNF
ncbi:SusC/RagA family TonB-linked outer membrane protein [Pedobacter sp. MC2016-15]|uniref:SusC/RagA family TonB-linked outer membrane protein n=1 Tax=Pedobacter sp. MC2016-15 TaxID=2994473 RepID=UPI0022456E69|nr:SusC/RagA family TonB-linked outer membrane protein [Pedobacter sp. MC2016-15]MCX2479446.1 SusC/RagA family TonB-linked outer membrane protein [Pedobacter sp. MC2016-15]